MKKFFKDDFGLICMFILISIIFTVLIINKNKDKHKDISKLTVTGKAILSVSADRMNLKVGVVNVSKTVESAIDANSIKMSKIENKLHKIGLEISEYKTGQFQVIPQWSPKPKKNIKNWEPKIIGYKVINSLIIKTKKLVLAGKIIESSIAQGANSVNLINFDLADSEKFQLKAIKKATQNAHNKAKTLAKSSNCKLAKILSINLDNVYSNTARSSNDRFMTFAKQKAAPIKVKPGNIDLRATVTVVYEIAQ